LVLKGLSRNPARREINNDGYAYDPWSSSQILNLQCHPDWNASTDVHDATKYYANDPEAFLVILLGEFNVAQKCFEDVYNEITKLVMPPLEFMFDSEIRVSFLFEIRNFTYSRRYFWACQTLRLINESMSSTIDAYERTFTDLV